MKTTYTSAKLAKIYMTRIVCLHGVPRTIILDRGTQFTSKFWNQLHETLGTRLEFSTAFHPQTDGQTERVNQILEDMLRACVLDYGSSWDDNLPYAEFSYNNSYQTSLKMPLSKLYTEGGAEHHCCGMVLETENFLAPILSETRKRRSS